MLESMEELSKSWKVHPDLTVNRPGDALRLAMDWLSDVLRGRHDTSIDWEDGEAEERTEPRRDRLEFARR
jgi:hypothetical protein